MGRTRSGSKICADNGRTMSLRLPAILLVTALLVAAGGAGAGRTAEGRPGRLGQRVRHLGRRPGQAGASAGGASAPGPAPTGAADGFAYPADGSIARTGALSSSVAARCHRHGGRPGRDRRALHLALQRRDHRRLRGGAREGRPPRARTPTGSRRLQPRARRPPVDRGPEPALRARRLGLRRDAGAGGRLHDRRRRPGRARGGDRAARRPHGRPRRPARRLRDPRRPRRGGRVDTGQAPPEAQPTPTAGPKAAPRAVPEATSRRSRCRSRPSRSARPGRSTSRRRPTSRRRSHRAATSSRSTGRRRSSTRSAARAGVGWHHGEDIFAPLGAPLLAVADGTVFSVGWNDLGGYRLWLRDRQGNQFYYAHLSAFSPLARNGNEVHAGDVVGFVGNTGDAQSTPYHLHFEIHPVGAARRSATTAWSSRTRT